MSTDFLRHWLHLFWKKINAIVNKIVFLISFSIRSLLVLCFSVLLLTANQMVFPPAPPPPLSLSLSLSLSLPMHTCMCECMHAFLCTRTFPSLSLSAHVRACVHDVSVLTEWALSSQLHVPHSTPAILNSFWLWHFLTAVTGGWLQASSQHSLCSKTQVSQGCMLRPVSYTHTHTHIYIHTQTWLSLP